ncbi:conserved hypothetical protein [Ixodes scapularis]|uniref:RNase H type-1 domain-containing protein n=1 Tax=Ixodes scapularis TaxID=6945 RepID=B7PY05_IXOSC|nr:conserved hypothetical protein [Ixodes scapularis]|eukprot:XP_002402293.1 conserved hypothetical protein [Ixodes scapularis]
MEVLLRRHEEVVGPAGQTASLPPSFLEPRLVDVSLELPNLICKRAQDTTVTRQLALDHLAGDRADWLHVFTDGSVDPVRGTASAAVFIPHIGRRLAERLTFHASSTTAELAAIETGLRELFPWPPGRAVVLSDSRTALRHLLRTDDAPPLARSVVSLTLRLRDRGWEIAFQWVPSHCGIPGNEEADKLAGLVHDNPDFPASTASRFNDARLLVRRRERASHPDPATAAGRPPVRVSRRLPRGHSALLHRLRTDSASSPLVLSVLQPDLYPACPNCGDEGSAGHLFLRCERYVPARAALAQRYAELGLPATTETALLFPPGPQSTVERAHNVLLEYLDDAGLSSRL